MGRLSQICEEIRSQLYRIETSSGDNAIDDQGWKGCFQRSVFEYNKKTGLPIDGLWVAVEAVVSGHNKAKVLQRLYKSWGGSLEDWVKWFMIAQKMPDCR